MPVVDNGLDNKELDEREASVTNNQPESRITSFFWGVVVDYVVLNVEIMSAFGNFVSNTIKPEIVGESHVTVIAEANEALKEQNEDNKNLINQVINTNSSLEIILENNSQSQKLDSEIIKKEIKSSESVSKAIDILEEETSQLKDTPLKDCSEKEEKTKKSLKEQVNNLKQQIEDSKSKYLALEEKYTQLKDTHLKDSSEQEKTTEELLEDQVSNLKQQIEDITSEFLEIDQTKEEAIIFLANKVEELEDKIKQLESNSPLQQQEISNNISFFSHQKNKASSDMNNEESFKIKVG